MTIILFLPVLTVSYRSNTRLQISPQVALLHDHVDLRCNYELVAALYSIKFYHNGEEFYRFIPRDTIPVRIFQRKGLKVQQTEHFHNWIRLLGVTEATEGLFTCEVSTEGPFFETYSDGSLFAVKSTKETFNEAMYKIQTKFMILFPTGPPQDPPTLTYEEEEDGFVLFKCSSPDPLLKGRLMWTVDGEVLKGSEIIAEESVSILNYAIKPGEARTHVQCRLILGSSMLYNKSTEVVLFQGKTSELSLIKSGARIITCHVSFILFAARIFM